MTEEGTTVAATPKRDTATEPSPPADEAQAPPARPEPSAEELERLRRKLIEKFHN